MKKLNFQVATFCFRNIKGKTSTTVNPQMYVFCVETALLWHENRNKTSYDEAKQKNVITTNSHLLFLKEVLMTQKENWQVISTNGS